MPIVQTGWKSERIHVFVRIADFPEMEVVQFTSDFELNAIPTASIVIPLGRRADDVRMVSEIHDVIDKMTNKLPISVFMDARELAAAMGGANLPRAFPTSGRVRIWDGYTTGAGYQRTASAANYIIASEHWLADLAFSSCLSATLHPSNPGNLIFQAAIRMKSRADTGVTIKADNNFVGATIAFGIIGANQIEKDLWGQGIQKWLLALSGQDLMIQSDLTARLGIPDEALPKDNADARLALRRFEPLFSDRGLKGKKSEGYQVGVPLEMDLKIATINDVLQNITVAIGSDTLENVSSQTYWDKLLAYSATYFFAVVPLIERALIVPYIPGLRKEWITISANEYDRIDLKSGMPRILRGVAIWGGRGFEGGSDMVGQGPQPNYPALNVGGYFEGRPSGQIIVKEMPLWLSKTDITSGAAGAAGINNPRANAVDPVIILPPDFVEKVKKLFIAPQLAKKKVLGDAVAQAHYVYEELKERQGTIGGKLRFDIAPGSVVRIDAVGEKSFGAEDKLGQEMFATVLRTSFIINSEQPSASTSFTLAHIRNKAENEEDASSIDRHPLYKTTWSGGKMLEYS